MKTMRQVKFRAWDSTSKHMAVQGTPDLETLASFMHHYADKELMQNTGLRDAEGNEIYEGDILSSIVEADGEVGFSYQQVFFNENAGCWCLDISFESDFTNSEILYNSLEDYDYVVVGNIYQNPELLEKH